MSDSVDIAVTSNLWGGAPKAEAVVLSSIHACSATFEDPDGDAEVSVVLCDDAEIRRLNKQWRGKDKATNVLSFPPPPGPGADRHRGDIVIAFETVAREAVEERKPFDAHLAHMVVHGYLHLAGYDHESDPEAEEMEQLEREILSTLGIADPYAPAAEPVRSSR